MNVMRKIYLLVFLGSLLVSSCAKLQEDIPATAIPSVTTPVAVSSPVTSSNLIPKHNDLIFVEFFAVT